MYITSRWHDIITLSVRQFVCMSVRCVSQSRTLYRRARDAGTRLPNFIAISGTSYPSCYPVLFCRPITRSSYSKSILLLFCARLSYFLVKTLSPTSVLTDKWENILTIYSTIRVLNWGCKLLRSHVSHIKWWHLR